MLTPEQYRAMILGMAFYMRPDEHPRYTVGNVYTYIETFREAHNIA